MTFPDDRTLGSELRAGRLGFHWLPDLDRYVRVSDHGADDFLVELAAPDELPKRHSPTPHRCWWEPADDSGVVVTCLFLMGRRMVRAGVRAQVFNVVGQPVECDIPGNKIRSEVTPAASSPR